MHSFDAGAAIWFMSYGIYIVLLGVTSQTDCRNISARPTAYSTGAVWDAPGEAVKAKRGGLLHGTTPMSLIIALWALLAGASDEEIRLGERRKFITLTKAEKTKISFALSGRTTP
jgi:hypothetical protein